MGEYTMRLRDRNASENACFDARRKQRTVNGEEPNGDRRPLG